MRAAAVASVALVVVLGTAACSDGGDSQNDADAGGTAATPVPGAGKWDATVAPLRRSLDTEAQTLAVHAAAWLAGDRPDDRFASDVAGAETRLLALRDQLEELPAPGALRSAADLHRSAVRLHLEAARVYEAVLATDPIDADVRGALGRVARRISTLAAVVLEAGRAAVSPEPAAQLARLDVPEWRATPLAPAPPLDQPPDRAPATASGGRQPLADWVALLRQLGVANALTLAEAIDGRDVDGLAAEASGLTVASDRVAAAPPPRGADELVPRVRLVLLVHAEAARAAIGAALVADPGQGDALTSVARRVAAAGDLAWPAAPVVRSSGFPADAEEGL